MAFLHSLNIDLSQPHPKSNPSFSDPSLIFSSPSASYPGVMENEMQIFLKIHTRSNLKRQKVNDTYVFYCTQKNCLKIIFQQTSAKSGEFLLRNEIAKHIYDCEFKPEAVLFEQTKYLLGLYKKPLHRFMLDQGMLHSRNSLIIEEFCRRQLCGVQFWQKYLEDEVQCRKIMKKFKNMLFLIRKQIKNKRYSSDIYQEQKLKFEEVSAFEQPDCCLGQLLELEDILTKNYEDRTKVSSSSDITQQTEDVEPQPLVFSSNDEEMPCLPCPHGLFQDFQGDEFNPFQKCLLNSQDVVLKEEHKGEDLIVEGEMWDIHEPCVLLSSLDRLELDGDPKLVDHFKHYISNNWGQGQTTAFSSEKPKRRSKRRT